VGWCGIRHWRLVAIGTMSRAAWPAGRCPFACRGRARIESAPVAELSPRRSGLKRTALNVGLCHVNYRRRNSARVRPATAVKYAWLDLQLHGYPVLALCEVLDVGLSGYRSWKRGGTSQRKRLTDVQLLTLIRSVHAKVKGAYGSPAHDDRNSRAWISGAQRTGGAADAGEQHPCAP
jgi:hypothetical protein